MLSHPAMHEAGLRPRLLLQAKYVQHNKILPLSNGSYPGLPLKRRSLTSAPLDNSVNNINHVLLLLGHQNGLEFVGVQR